MANVNFFDFAEHILSTPASGDVGAMQHLANAFREEYCEKLYSHAYDNFTTAKERYTADPEGNGSGEVHIQALQANLYIFLVFGDKCKCLKTLKELKEFTAEIVDELVMENAPVEVTFDDPERNLTGEGAVIEVCAELKTIVEYAQKFVELAFRLDMALKKFGKSFWKEE